MATSNGKIDQSGTEDAKIVLGILQAIDSGDRVTQRAVASELGIALGLVNAYVKRCMSKGLVKIKSAPARRYAYYLTPKGFAEKSKLTASYFAHSFAFFRTARADCEAVLAEAVARRMKMVALVGASELAEIIKLCAVEQPVQLVAIVDRLAKVERYAGLPVVSGFGALGTIDGLIVTDISDPYETYQAAVAAAGAGRVLAPALLRVDRARKPKARKSEVARAAR